MHRTANIRQIFAVSYLFSEVKDQLTSYLSIKALALWKLNQFYEFFG